MASVREQDTQTYDIFLSYARQDDEPFVKRLYGDLTKAGYRVWWDRQCMPSRALTFTQEIRDAIAGCERMIAVVGPKALESEYVRYEWQHALLLCKPVVPVLRLGEYFDLPFELEPDSDAQLGVHCPDFRQTRAYNEAHAELVRILAQPVPHLGQLRTDVPSLPPAFQSRVEDIRHLNETLLADTTAPVVITAEHQTAALHGMGGIGKSTLAAAFVRSRIARRRFTDGIVWLKVGQSPDLLELVRLLAAGFDAPLGDYYTLGEACARLPRLLENKASCIVLANVWDSRYAEPFRKALGPRCRLLVTTQYDSVVGDLGAVSYDLSVLSEEASVKLLVARSDWSSDAPPPEETSAIAAECGYLPLALQVVGALLRGSPAERWVTVLEELRHADRSVLKPVFRALAVSVDALECADRERYLDLAVFPEGSAIPEETLVTMWKHGGLSTGRAQHLIDDFVSRSLCSRDARARITLHDLQRDHARSCVDDLRARHEKLLDAYESMCPDGWPSGPNDGYYFEWLPYHLAEAGRAVDKRALLLGYPWMAAKLEETDIVTLLRDYEDTTDKALALLEGTLRLSTHALADDGTLLPSQLTGRLLSCGEPEVERLLADVAASARRPWLRPLAPTLERAGGPIERFLQGHATRPLRTFFDRHSVSAVAALPENRVVSGSYDHMLRVWDLSGGTSRVLEGHMGSVTTVAALPENRVVSGSSDFTLRVWDLRSGESQVLKQHSWVSAVAALPDDRVVVGSIDTLRVWDLSSGESRILEGHTGWVRAVAALPENRVVSGSSDRTLRVWDLSSGESLVLEGHTDSVTALAILPDNRVISGSYDNTLRVWDLSSGESRVVEGHTGSVTAVAALPENRVIVGSSDHTLRVWDLSSGESRVVEGHTGSVTAVAALPENRVIVGSSDHALRVLDLSGERHVTEGHTDAVTALRILPDNRVISGSYDNTLRVWDLSSGESRVLEGHTDSVTAVAALPENRVISGSDDNTLRVWDLSSGESRALEGHTGSVTIVAALPENRVISGSDDNTLRVWDLCSGESRVLEGHTGLFAALAILPENRVVSWSDDHTLRVWDLSSGESRVLEGHTGSVTDLAILPENRVVSGSRDHTLRVWDLSSGESRVLEGHTGSVTIVAALPENRVISGSDDHALRVWDLSSGESRVLEGHTDWISALAALPENRVISGSDDHALRVWDLSSGESRVLEGHTGSVTALAILPENRVVSWSSDQALRVWDLSSGETHAHFCADAPVTSCAVVVADETITVAAADGSGRVHILRLEEN